MFATPRIARSLVFAAGIALNHVSATAQHTQQYSFQLPAFTTQDNFIYQSQQDLSVPYFNIAGGKLYLTEAKFNVQYTSSATYMMTNISHTGGWGRIKSEPVVLTDSPDGPFWTVFGNSTNGPFLDPGQSGIATTSGTDRTRIKGWASAQPFVGLGNYTVPISITQTHSVVEPANYTAEHNNGTVNPATFTVTYTYRCLGDVDVDSEVDIDDLLAIVGAWGFIGGCANFQPCPPDIAPPWGNNVVDMNDLLTVISNWGQCPSPTQSMGR